MDLLNVLLVYLEVHVGRTGRGPATNAGTAWTDAVAHALQP